MASNGVMMLAALRHLHYPSQKEYMSLVAEVNQAEGKIGGKWRNVLDSLELGLSQVLDHDRGDGMLRARLEDMLRKWRMPQLLIRLWEIQSDDVEISGLIKTLLQALMSPSPLEEISNIRSRPKPRALHPTHWVALLETISLRNLARPCYCPGCLFFLDCSIARPASGPRCFDAHMDVPISSLQAKAPTEPSALGQFGSGGCEQMVI